MDLRMDLRPEDREDAWLLLAELFFLDTEHSDQVFQTAAESLKRMGLGREDAENILTYEVAPVAGFNLGYLLWPVIGAWDGLDREPCAARLEGTSSAGQGDHDGTAADGENAEIGEALEPAVGSLGFDQPGRLQAGYRDFT